MYSKIYNSIPLLQMTSPSLPSIIQLISPDYVSYLNYVENSDNTVLIKRDGVALKLILTNAPSQKYIEQGELEIRINGVVHTVLFSNQNMEGFEEWGIQRQKFILLIDTVSRLPDLAREEMRNYMITHLPAEGPSTHFNSFLFKSSNLYLVYVNGEKNIKVELKTLEDKQIEAIHRQLKKPISPFDLIKTIATTRDLFELLATNFLSYRGDTTFEPRVKRELQTSCTLTAPIIASLFFGVDKFKAMLRVLNKPIIENEEYVIPSGRSIKICYDRLFYGTSVTELYREDPLLLMNECGEVVDAMAAKHAEYIARFDDYLSSQLLAKGLDKPTVPPEKWDTEVTQTIQEVVEKYPFSLKNFEYLREDFAENTSHVSEKHSYCYYITLFRMGGYPAHAFVIEQFLRTEDQTTCYRLYQSWVGQFSLEEHLEKKKKNGKDFAVMNENEFKEFLNNLSVFFKNTDLNKNGKKLGKIFQASWGLHSQPSYFNGSVIAAADLFYWCEPVNPADCWNNFVAFASPK